MSEIYKSFKLLLVSFVSLFLYYFIGNYDCFKSLQLKLDKHLIHRGFEFFILTNITKYFFLLLGIVAIIFLILRIFKKKNKCT